MRKTRVRTSLAIGTLCVFCLVGLAAQPAYAKDEVEITISENMEMASFLSAVAQTTGLRLVWNPTDKNIRGKTLKGGITLRGARSEVYALARGLLTFYELVIIPVGPDENRLYLVADARQTSAILRIKPLSVELTEANLARYESADGLFITTTIHVENLDDLRNARNALSRVVTGQNIGNVTEVPDAQAFVVTDFAPNVVAIYRLLKAMDAPRAKASTASGKTVAVRLEHASALELAAILARHYMPAAATPAARSGRQAPSGVRRAGAPRITADGRTNSILVTGDDAEIKHVQAAIALLDVPVVRTSVAAHVVELKKMQANYAAALLSQIVGKSPALFAEGAARPAIVAYQPDTASAGSLLISASVRDFATLKQIIEGLDR